MKACTNPDCSWMGPATGREESCPRCGNGEVIVV